MNLSFQPVMARRLTAVLVVSSWMLAGCATGPQAHPQDPFEPYNRSMSRFNEVVDEAVLKPVATGYQQAVPALARTGVSNFFANLGDAWSFVNNTLQLRGEAAMSSFFRFSINTMLGLGGVLDIASEMRLERHKQDFGLTLGHWGYHLAPMWCCRCWGHLRCVIRWPCRSIAKVICLVASTTLLRATAYMRCAWWIPVLISCALARYSMAQP